MYGPALSPILLKYQMASKTTNNANSQKMGRMHNPTSNQPGPMIGENRQLVTNEPVEFEK